MKKAYVNFAKENGPDINESKVSDDNIRFIYGILSFLFQIETNVFKSICENNMPFELDFEDLKIK